MKKPIAYVILAVAKKRNESAQAQNETPVAGTTGVSSQIWTVEHPFRLIAAIVTV